MSKAWERLQPWLTRIAHAEMVLSVFQFARALVGNPYAQAGLFAMILLVWTLLTGDFGPYVFVAMLALVPIALAASAARLWRANQQSYGPELAAIRDAAKAPPEVRREIEYRDPPDYKWLRDLRDQHRNMGASAVFPKTQSQSDSLPMTLWVRVHRLEPDLVLTAEYFNRSIFDLQVSNVFGKLAISDIGSFDQDVLKAEGTAASGHWFSIDIYVTIKTESAQKTIANKLNDGQVIRVDLQHLQVRMKMCDQPGTPELQVKLADEWNPQVQVHVVPQQSTT